MSHSVDCGAVKDVNKSVYYNIIYTCIMYKCSTKCHGLQVSTLCHNKRGAPTNYSGATWPKSKPVVGVKIVL